MEHKPAIGHRVVLLDSVDSTNNFAAKGLARHELQHGTAILAMEQTAGRGQRGRVWSTADGLDIAASIVLLPEALAAVDQFMLSRMASLAVHDVVADALREAGSDPAEVRIKWPNDILIGRSKVAGILIVNELKGPWLASAIIGIGLNVNSRGWPEAYRATSLVQETRTVHKLRTVLDRLCARLEHWWRLLAKEPAVLADAYASRLWALGRFTAFTLDGQPLTARPLDVDASGRLLVEQASGAVAAYSLERLRFVR